MKLARKYHRADIIWSPAVWVEEKKSKELSTRCVIRRVVGNPVVLAK